MPLIMTLNYIIYGSVSSLGECAPLFTYLDTIDKGNLVMKSSEFCLFVTNLQVEIWILRKNDNEVQFGQL